MSIGLYPGTFDPITNGHIDIITRAAKHLVDELVIGVAKDTEKNALFSLKERKAFIEQDISLLPQNLQKKIRIESFSGLLVNYVDKIGARFIIRGLRAVSDFEYEFQMAGMNARLAPHIETVFLMSSEQQQFISSRFVKEIARLGGNITSFVSKHVAAELKSKYSK